MRHTPWLTVRIFLLLALLLGLTGNLSAQEADPSVTLSTSLNPSENVEFGAGSDLVYQRVNEVEVSWPTVTITSAPADVSYSTEATFEFTSDPEGAEFECSLVEGATVDLETVIWSPCASPHPITGLSYSQAYGFLVKAKGAPVAAPYLDGHQWYISFPTVTITGGPADPSESTEATFTFITNATGADFECYLGAQDLADANSISVIQDWSPCVSPRTFARLSRGYRYAFAVRVMGTPEGASWANWYWSIPKLTLTASPNPSEYGEEVTFTALVWDEGGAPPAGTISFLRLTYSMGVAMPEALGPGVGPSDAGADWYAYTFSTSLLPVGTHEIVAVYAEDGKTYSSAPRVQVVEEATAQPPVVTSHPANHSVCVGSGVSFSAAASGTPVPTVQWWVSSDGGTTWSAISGATGTTYAFTAAATDNGKRYRAVFTNSAGTATSSAALLTVNTPPVVTTHPSNQTVTYGALSADFFAGASGTSPSVQWQQSPNGTTWTGIAGATTPNLSIANPTVAMSGTQYRAVFTNMCGSATTNGATLMVNKKDASVTTTDQSKTYGDDNPPLTATVVGTVGGDVLDYTLSTTAGKLSDVGEYPIVVTLGSNPNYNVTTTNGTLTVSQKGASVTADDKSKAYGEDNPELTATLVGRVAGGDSISYTLSTTAAKVSAVGDYPIAVALGSNPNYNVTTADGTLSIDKRDASVTADDKTKTYGEDKPELTAMVSGEVDGGDAVSYTLSTTAETLSNVGEYPILVTRGSNPNYNVTTADGTLSIDKKDASVTADDKTKTYGEDNPELTVMVSGEVDGGDAVSYTLSTTAEKLSNVGEYPIVVTLGCNSNYTMTKTDGTLTVNQKVASVTPDSFTRQYSDLNPTFTGMLSGFLDIDEITAGYWTAATPASAPGSYAITATLKPEDRLGNYSITYHVGTLTVVKEDAIVSFDASNEVSVQVAAPGGESPGFVVRAYVEELVPDLPETTARPGDISLADVEIALVPVGLGSPVMGVCSELGVEGSGYDAAKEVACVFEGVPVKTYSVEARVVGDYYTGGPAEDVLVVYDPSLGFTTGGGWFYWPGTSERTNFGYTMKYNKKATNIQGSLLLIRHLADGTIYRVKSNALYGLALGEDAKVPMGWGSFSGKSTYQEPEWAEPMGNYEFITYVEDRNAPGTGVDRFWIEVKGGLTLLGDATENAVEIGGGNVVVPHRAK